MMFRGASYEMQRKPFGNSAPELAPDSGDPVDRKFAKIFFCCNFSEKINFPHGVATAGCQFRCRISNAFFLALKNALPPIAVAPFCDLKSRAKISTKKPETTPNNTHTRNNHATANHPPRAPSVVDLPLPRPSCSSSPERHAANNRTTQGQRGETT